MSEPNIFHYSREMYGTNCTEPKVKGTIVKLGMNAGPDYEIVHVEGETAWIRQPVTFKHECLVPLWRLRVVL